ncbi:MAG: hypothetical protein WC997_06375 [Porticoccaceae bacterium]
MQFFLAVRTLPVSRFPPKNCRVSSALRALWRCLRAIFGAKRTLIRNGTVAATYLNHEPKILNKEYNPMKNRHSVLKQAICGVLFSGLASTAAHAIPLSEAISETLASNPQLLLE